MPELIFQFSTSREWSSQIIRDVCRCPFSHLDAVTDEATQIEWGGVIIVPPPGSLYGASNSPKAPIVAGNANGVAVRTWDYQQFLRRRRARVPVTDEQYRLFWQLASQEMGKDFDQDAIAFKYWFSDQPFTREWRYDLHWFCAELHTYLCERIDLWGYPALIPKNGVSPDRLLDWLWPKMSNRREFWLFPPELTPMEGEEINLLGLTDEKLAQMFNAR